MEYINITNEAAHEAAGRKMRAIINAHSETHIREIEAAEAAQRRRERAAEIAAQKEHNLCVYFLHLCVAVLVASAVCIWCAVGIVSATTCWVVFVLACAYCLLTTAAYMIRNRTAPAVEIAGEG